MTGEQFIRFSISKLENKLFETREELAALKASIPQIKHDAIMDAIKIRNGSGTYDIASYAKSILTQAKDVK
jgi:hypothetical protein